MTDKGLIEKYGGIVKAIAIDEEIENDDDRKNIIDIIDNIEDEQSRLVMLYYHEGEMNLKEIGEILGLSESRISQIRSKTIKNIRRKIKVLDDYKINR